MRIDERQIRLYFDDQFVVCAPDLQMSRDKGEGYVVADTRLASGYRIRIVGVEPNLPVSYTHLTLPTICSV